MDEKKEVSKNFGIGKNYSKLDNSKRNDFITKSIKPKMSMKKVARSRNQKGHKNY